MKTILGTAMSLTGFLPKKYECLLFAQNKKTFWRAQSLVVLSAG